MNQNKKINKVWIPFWVDKWLFGSTRLELQPDERSVWLDLLALASKNEGFICANATTPYLDSQLAGLLVIPVELLQRTINKCIEYGKIEKLENGTHYIAKWEQYQLSKRHKRRFKKRFRIEEQDCDHRIEEKRIEEKRIEENRREENSVSKKEDIASASADITQSITGWWSYYNLCLKNKGWIKRELKLTYARKRLILSRLKEYSMDDLKKCVDNFVSDEWEERHRFIDPRYCIGIIGGRDLLERWLNADAKAGKDVDTWAIMHQRTKEMLERDRQKDGGK